MSELKDDQSQKTVGLSKSSKLMTGVVIFCSATILFWYLSHRDAEIATRQQVVVGNIQTASRGRHDTVTYDFQFDGKDYLESEDHNSGLTVGQRVKVYVDPAHPSTNSLRDFHVNSVWNHRQMTVFFYLSIGLAILTANVWRIKTRIKRPM